MYGINPLTNECAYKTPCGWCARLNKECTKNKGHVKDNDYARSKEYVRDEGYVKNRPTIGFVECTYYRLPHA